MMSVIEVCCPGIHGKTTFFSSNYLVICTSNYPELFFLPSYLIAAVWLFSVYLDFHVMLVQWCLDVSTNYICVYDCSLLYVNGSALRITVLLCLKSVLYIILFY